MGMTDRNAAGTSRPSAVRSLGRSDISGDPRLKIGLDAAEIVLQQNEFRRYGRVGLELEDPVAVRMLQSQQRFAGTGDGPVEPGHPTPIDKRRRFSGRHSVIHGGTCY